MHLITHTLLIRVIIKDLEILSQPENRTPHGGKNSSGQPNCDWDPEDSKDIPGEIKIRYMSQNFVGTQKIVPTSLLVSISENVIFYPWWEL